MFWWDYKCLFLWDSPLWLSCCYSHTPSNIYSLDLELNVTNGPHNGNHYYPFEMPLCYVKFLSVCTANLGCVVSPKALIYSFAYLSKLSYSYEVTNWYFGGQSISVFKNTFMLVSCWDNWLIQGFCWIIVVLLFSSLGWVLACHPLWSTTKKLGTICFHTCRKEVEICCWRSQWLSRMLYWFAFPLCNPFV